METVVKLRETPHWSYSAMQCYLSCPLKYKFRYIDNAEVELPDGLNSEQLNGKIHETFALVRNSVEAELHGATPAVTVTTTPAAPQGGNTGNYSHSRKGNSNNDAPASPKQIKFLLDLARNCGITPEQIKARFGVAVLEALTRTQCSRAIERIRMAI